MSKRVTLPGLCLLPSTVIPAGAGFWDFLTLHRDIEVITVTDMTPDGRLLKPATPQAPAYYHAHDLGFQELGGVMAGEKEPPAAAARQFITRALAIQGYLSANEKTPPPTLVLVMTWGTLNTKNFHGPNPDFPPQQLNRQQILRFLGGYKMGLSAADFDPLVPPLGGLSSRNHEAREYMEAATDDYYIAVVAAYDFDSIMARKPKLMWMTRISCPSRGFWLDEVMPTMLVIGGPNFGRESAKPSWVNASDRFKPEVRMGDLKFLEESASSVSGDSKTKSFPEK